MNDDRRQHSDRREVIRGGRREMDAESLRGAIAGRIRVAMNRRHMSCRALADLAACSDVTVANVLEGKNTQLDTILHIAYALELSLPDLFTPRQSETAN